MVIRPLFHSVRYFGSQIGKLPEKLSLYIYGPSPYPLKAERVHPSEFPLLSFVAKDWKETAEKKRKWALGASKEHFNDLAWISGRLETVLRTVPRIFHEIHICKDARERIQGIMHTTLGFQALYINYLATNPNNIRSFQNLNRISGAGTSLIQNAETRALETNKPAIILDALPKAIPFYDHLGFVLKRDNNIDANNLMNKDLRPKLREKWKCA